MANHIPGYTPPPEIEGFIPDIYAIKYSTTHIMEVVTVAGLDADKLYALKAYSRSFKGIEFSCWMVDSAGCRMMQVE